MISRIRLKVRKLSLVWQYGGLIVAVVFQWVFGSTSHLISQTRLSCYQPGLLLEELRQRIFLPRKQKYVAFPESGKVYPVIKQGSSVLFKLGRDYLILVTRPLYTRLQCIVIKPSMIPFIVYFLLRHPMKGVLYPQ